MLCMWSILDNEGTSSIYFSLINRLWVWLVNSPHTISNIRFHIKLVSENPKALQNHLFLIPIIIKLYFQNHNTYLKIIGRIKKHMVFIPSPKSRFPNLVRKDIRYSNGMQELNYKHTHILLKRPKGRIGCLTPSRFVT